MSGLNEECERNIEAAAQLLRQRLEGIAAGEAPEEKERFLSDMAGFETLFRKFVRDQELGNAVNWSRIELPESGLFEPYEELPAPSSEEEKELLSKLVVLKLNGGLGTTMGCSGPKSTIEVRSGRTFLDLIVAQVKGLNSQYGVDIPLVLMNSFNTDEDTRKVLRKYSASEVTVLSFLQSCFPRLSRSDLAPLPEHVTVEGGNGRRDWYPPGHGDLYESLCASPLMEQLIASGKEYLFVSNVDNLGATVDVNILKRLEESGADFLMEVTSKTPADVKGGTIIHMGGKPRLLELAQVPPQHIDEFKSIKKFKIFNTNNLWMRLSSIRSAVEKSAMDDMDVLVNRKTLHGTELIQLERAAGAAIRFFPRSMCVNVPRSRFLPVKSTSDLFIVQSNLYTHDRGRLMLSERRAFPNNPLVKLGGDFKCVGDYLARFRSSIPNIVDLEHLTVSGDVVFGGNVTLAGTVIILAQQGQHIDIPEGSYLENKVVTGSMVILDV